jgi:SAM-dependent methyltransferase
MKLTSDQDAFGHAVWDHYHGKPGYEIIERSDGLFAVSGGPAVYLSEPVEWRAHETAALELAAGKVLDIGCNAGRHALYLQGKGLDVTGVDNSPLAVKIAKLRGLAKARVLSITELSARLGTFDTIVMLGNNFGLFGSASRARWLLRRFKGFTRPGARLIVESLDVYKTDLPEHLEYIAANTKRGRMGGQIRMRGRYKRFATPWFDYLMVSPEEMESLVAGTGWRIARLIDARNVGPVYAAIIERPQV